MMKTKRLFQRLPLPVWLVVSLLVMASMACMRQTDTLNQGRGTRDDPVTALQFARTLNYSIRGMSVSRPYDVPRRTARENYEFVGVEFEILCTRDDEEICDLDEIATEIRLVSDAGHLFTPRLNLTLDNPLEGQILGNSRKVGWVVFEVPITMPVKTGTVAFASEAEDLVFFSLP